MSFAKPFGNGILTCKEPFTCCAGIEWNNFADDLNIGVLPIADITSIAGNSNSLFSASNSRTRKDILNNVGLIYEVKPSDIEEHSDKSDPKDYVMDLSWQKAEAVAQGLKEGVILSADSIIYIDNKKLEKPKTKEEATKMLKSLSGRVNYAVTGVTIILNQIIFFLLICLLI